MRPGFRNLRVFPSTDWRLVFAARPPGSGPRESVAKLCSIYWHPVYAYLRRRGHRADEAEDLTQGFFAHVLGKRLLERAQPQKGRLRSLLLASLTNFVANERDRSAAQKRGGEVRVDFDVTNAEAWYMREVTDGSTPERIYERRWATALLDRVLDHLRDELTRSGKGQMFDVLKSHLTGEPNDVSYRHAVEALHMSDGAVRVAAHRLRRRYRDLLRSEIARTVGRPEQDVDDEIKYLFNATRP